MKNFGEQEAWAYPGTAQIFRVPILSQERVKLRTLNFARTFYGLNRNKSPLKILEKRERGRILGLPKIYGYPYYPRNG